MGNAKATVFHFKADGTTLNSISSTITPTNFLVWEGNLAASQLTGTNWSYMTEANGGRFLGIFCGGNGFESTSSGGITFLKTDGFADWRAYDNSTHEWKTFTLAPLID